MGRRDSAEVLATRKMPFAFKIERTLVSTLRVQIGATRTYLFRRAGIDVMKRTLQRAWPSNEAVIRIEPNKDFGRWP